MAYVTKQRLRRRADRRIGTKTAGRVLEEEITASAEGKTFNVFLSHSYLDKKLIIGAKKEIEDQGYSVFIDWIDAVGDLSRDDISAETADYLKDKMKACDCLVYAHTDNAILSKWCPWELGYFDALKGRVYILPIVDAPNESFPHQEYLHLYPYISEDYSELLDVRHDTLQERIEAFIGTLKRR